MIQYIEKFGLEEEGLLRVPGAIPRVKVMRSH